MASQQDEIAQLEAEKERLLLEKEREQLLAQAPSDSGSIAETAAEIAPMAETAIRNLAEGMSFGASEPILSSLNAATQNLIRAGENPKDVADFFANAFSPERISEAYQVDLERRRQLKREYPAASAFEVLGAMLPQGLVAKAAGALAGGAGKLTAAAAETELAKKLSQLPGAALTGRLVATGAAGAATAAPLYATQKAIEETAGFVKPGELPPVSEVAAMGAAIPAGLVGAIEAPGAIGRAAPAVAKAGGTVGKKALTAVFGIPEGAIGPYLENAPLVREYLAGAKELERLKQKPLGAGVTEQLQQKANVALEPLREELAAAQAGVEKTTAEAASAQKVMKTALAEDILEAQKELRTKLSEESSKSYEILDRKKGAADFSGLENEIESVRKSLEISGTGKIISSERKAVSEKLKEISKEAIEGLGEKTAVPFPRVKEVLQQIDDEIRKFDNPKNPSEFSEIGAAKLLEVRSLIDSRIKQIPEYDAQMAVVRKLRDLNNRVGLMTGDTTFGISPGRLTTMSRPGSLQAKTLKELGDVTQRDLTTPIAGVPVRPQLPPGVSIQPEYLSWVKSTEDAIAANDALLHAQNIADSVKGLMNSKENFNPIRSMMIGKDPKWESYLKTLTQLSGEDFSRQVSAARTAEQLLLDRTKGSRATNMLALTSGGLTYAVTGNEKTAGFVMGLGALLGPVVDKWGGQIGQKVLDAYLKISGVPTVGKLGTALASVPDELRTKIVADFARGVAASPQELFEIPKDQRQYAAIEIQNSPSLTPMQKAKASNMVINQGMIDADTMKLVMLSQPAELPMPQSAIERIFTPPRQARE